MRVSGKTRFSGGVFIVIVFSGAWAFGQTAQVESPPVPVRDPRAFMLLSQALSRLRSSPVAVTDITLTANATYTAGSDQETGTATLQASSADFSPSGNSAASAHTGVSRVVLNLDNGEREEIRNGPAGAWVGKDGAAHSMALHNCWVDADWFYPLLTLEAAAADPAVSITPAGQATLNGEAVDELVLSRIVPGQGAATITAEIQKLSTVHFYLDATTLVPVELEFNLHPDNDANRDIPVEIEFSDYRPVSGVLVPFHIQKLIQHSLLLNLRVTSAAVNSGLAASNFVLPAVSGGRQ